MSEPARRSALDGNYHVGRFGASEPDAPGIVLMECRAQSIVQVNGAPAAGMVAGALGVPESNAIPNRSFSAGTARYAWNGPGRWLAESVEHRPDELIELVDAALHAHGASTTDLSHARTVVQVSGSAATDLLAKLCPVDVEIMQKGDSAATLAGPFSVQIVRTGDEEFRLYVFRSFGLAMWEMLLDEAAEFGGEVISAG